jgi:hypothetical protein
MMKAGTKKAVMTPATAGTPQLQQQLEIFIRIKNQQQQRQK